MSVTFQLDKVIQLFEHGMWAWSAVITIVIAILYFGVRSYTSLKQAHCQTSPAVLSLARMFGCSSLVIGSVIAIAGLVWVVKTASFVMRAAEAPGKIVKIDRNTDWNGSAIYQPVFKFIDASGLVHTRRTSFGSSICTFELGEKIAVLYDPSKPTNCNIDSFQSVWLEPLLLSGFGLLFGGFACFWLLIVARSTRRENDRRGA